MVRALVYGMKGPMIKTIMRLKHCISLPSFQGQYEMSIRIMNIVVKSKQPPHKDSPAMRQLNPIPQKGALS